MTFVCDLWGVWAEAFGAPHLCEGVCEACCRAPEGARAVSACHQVLSRAQEIGKWLQQRGLSLRSSGLASSLSLGLQVLCSLSCLLSPGLFLGEMAAFSCGPMSLVLQAVAKGDNMGTRRHRAPESRHQATPTPEGGACPVPVWDTVVNT